MSSRRPYIQLFSLHGLVRSRNLEMGRDADTGGQTKYVVELAKAMASIRSPPFPGTRAPRP